VTGASLVFILMPTIVPIGSTALIALPFLAARNLGLGIASGIPAGAEGSAVLGTAIPAGPRPAPSPRPAHQAPRSQPEGTACSVLAPALYRQMDVITMGA
jgi:hypothetical protein